MASGQIGGGRVSASPRRIHLSGICGTAMASLAGLLRLEGHRVTGSDKAAYPPMSDLLSGLGIAVMEPYAEQNLDPKPDLVVIGNALSRARRWWWPELMEKPRPPACWPGFIRLPRAKTRRWSLRF
jgi:hypothetical protein